MTCGLKHSRMRLATAHTAIVLFGSSKFLGRDELGHSRTTVGLTRLRGVTVLVAPLISIVSIGMVQTVYYFTAHGAMWALDAEVYLFDGTPQHILDTVRPLEPITWASVPLAAHHLS